MVLAEQIADGPTKQSLLEMAAAWMRLAEQAEKNSASDLVYETPSPSRRPPPRPDAQQQQQQSQSAAREQE